MTDDEVAANLAKMLTGQSVIQDDGTVVPMDAATAARVATGLVVGDELIKSEDWDGVRARLSEIEGVTITALGGHVPIQGDGTYFDEPLYFRARYTSARLCVGTTKVDGDDDDGNVVHYPRLRAEMRVTVPEDDYGAGWLSPQDVEAIFPLLLAGLEERTHEHNVAAMQAWTDSLNALVADMKEKDPDG